MPFNSAFRALGLVLLFFGAFVTVSNRYRHCIADAPSLAADLGISQSLDAVAIHSPGVPEPVATVFWRPQAEVAAAAADPYLPDTGSRSPPRS